MFHSMAHITQQSILDDNLRKWQEKFAASQKPMDEDLYKILDQNRWDLYEKGE